jgi:hypothetical protein
MTDMASSAPEVSTTSAAPLPTAPVNTIQAVRCVYLKSLVWEPAPLELASIGLYAVEYA